MLSEFLGQHGVRILRDVLLHGHGTGLARFLLLLASGVGGLTLGGLFALLTTSLTSFQTTIFSSILSRYGYDGTLEVQSETAVRGIRIGAGLVPIIMCIVGMIPMLFFPIGRDLEEEISEFNVAARDGSLPKENEAAKTDR